MTRKFPKNLLWRLIKISRPKFWHYAAGPFVLGAIPVLKNDVTQLKFILPIFLWVLLAGNFFIYGINDLSDRDTDLFNEKKNDLDEVKIQEADLSILKKVLLATFFSGLPILALGLPGIFWGLFIFFSWQYSAFPIRAKARPFLDGLFNILYILPACLALTIGQNSLQPIWENLAFLAAGQFWCMAMHAFSAIPDIKADQSAGLKTTAVFLGNKKALLYCLSCYFLAAFSLATTNRPIAIVLILPYILCLSYLYFQPEIQVKSFYRYFPLSNFLIGMLLFFLVLFG